MAPDINNPGGVKNDPDEIRDAVVSDATKFPGGFIDEQITEAGAAVQIFGQFQVTNAAFNQSVDVSAQIDAVAGLAFKPDGTQLYGVGSNSNELYQYSLSTAFGVSTRSFDQSLDLSVQIGSPGGVTFKPDGNELYICDNSNANISQFSLSTAYDISTASFTQSFDVSTQDAGPVGVVFRPDGSQLFVAGDRGVNIYQYSLSTAYDISTASFTQSFDISPQDGNPREIVLKPDGRQLYLVGRLNDNIYQYSLSTAYDISTASFAQSFDVSPQSGFPSGLAFKPDGTRVYVGALSDRTIDDYVVGIIGSELG